MSVLYGMASSVMSSASNIEEMSDTELAETVEALRTSNKYMKLENQIFLNYLMKYDPKALAGMGQVLDMALKIHSTTFFQGIQSQMTLSKQSTDSVISFHSGKRSDASMIIGSSITDPKQRINLTVKIELLNREKKNREILYETYLKKSKIRKAALKAEIEEFTLQINEINERTNEFEETVVIYGVDPLTQRIPAEKIVRYMEEWLKNAETTIGKLRLRTSTLHYRYTFLKHQLAQKEELGETINPVDFDHMKIENKQLMKTIELKNMHLLLLKKTTGDANLVLSKHKIFLQNQLKELLRIKGAKEQHKVQIEKIENEMKVAQVEVGESEKQLKKIRSLLEMYEIPDILEYVNIKKSLYNLKKEKKVWSRRTNIQMIGMVTSKKALKPMKSQQKAFEFEKCA